MVKSFNYIPYSWLLRLSYLGGRVANGFQFSTHFLSECVCVCQSLFLRVHTL